MNKCLLMIGVQPADDFGLIADGVCSGVNCGNGGAAAFHPFKTKWAWTQCFRQATR